MTIVLMLSLFPSFLFAHLCHDPFRPQEHLHILPEKELIRIEDKGEFRMYIENTFSSILRDVQLLVESPAFEIEVEPPLLQKLAPGEKAFFVIKLNLKEGFKPGNYPLFINVKATQAELIPSIKTIKISAEKKIPEETLFKEEIEPKEQIQKKQRPVPKPKKALPKVKEPEVETKIEPEQEKEIKIEERPKEITVKVERIPFWRKPYFYLALILILILILLWRKRK